MSRAVPAPPVTVPPTRRADPRRGLSDHPLAVRLVVVIFVYGLALLLPFHSVVLHPQSRLAQGGNDATSGLRDYWSASVQHRNPFDFHHDAMLAAPQGSPYVPADVLAGGGLQTAFVWELKGPLGLIGAWNAFMVLGILATGVAMFAFLRALGCSFGSSLLGGYALAFSPYAVERVYAGHLGFVHNWVFPLLALFLLRFAESRSWRLLVAAGATIAAAFYLSAYQGLFAGTEALVFWVVELARADAWIARRRVVRAAAFTYGVTLAALLPIFVFYAEERSAVTTATSRSVSSLFRFGAVLSAYLVPSPRNPLFHWVASAHSSDLTEETLYFGYATLLLALTAVVLALRHDAWLRDHARRWSALLFLVALAPVAFLMSLPPREHVAGLSIPTPPVVIQSFTRMWRVYSRFGIVVGFAVIALAALGLTALGRRPARGWRLLTPLAAAVIVLELLPGNVRAFDAAKRPAWVAWLQSQPHGIVATYPWLTGTALAFDEWYQVYDGDPQFETISFDDREGAVRLLTRDIWRPISARILAAEGVKYVVVHFDQYGPPRPTPDPTQYKLLRRFGSVGIYSVQAPPIGIESALRANAGTLASLQGWQPSLSYGRGFNAAEQYEGTIGRWLIQDGALIVDSTLSTPVTLKTFAFSNSGPHTLEVKDARGKVLARTTIPAYQVNVSLGPFTVAPGKTTLTLVASPGPTALSAGDSRRASVFLGPIAANAVPPYLQS